MNIIVQKFGGTSLSTELGRTHVVHHIQHAIADNAKLVVVVSAMGRLGEPYATDTLLEWIRTNGDHLSARELDLLLSCGEIISAATICSLLRAAGIQSVVLNGKQAGIKTNLQYGNAQIEAVEPERIMNCLREDNVVIVPGFQGSRDDEVTTLGRGGSDTTAAALGSALKATYVDIFTDVEGVLTADPRIVKDARPLSKVTYQEICNMAYQGAKVIHPRAVEIAMQAGLTLRIRSTFSDQIGTIIRRESANPSRLGIFKDRYVAAIAHYGGIAQIQVLSREGQYDLQLKVFKAMAQEGISVDFINVNPNGVVYTVFNRDAAHAMHVLQSIGYEPQMMENCAKISIIGGGINGVPGIMAQIVEALTAEDIQILQTVDSNTTIWVLVGADDMSNAVRALHRSFQLHKSLT